MAPDKLSRDPGAGDEPTEGVRIIAAEELEEVAERSEVARRRPRDEPRFKDRPPAPPADVRPAIRFPLPDSADPAAVERPRPAPVDPPRAEGSVPDRPEPTPVSLGEEPADGEPTAAIDLTDASVGSGAGSVAADPAPAGSAASGAPDDLPPPPDQPEPGSGAEPVLDLGPSTGEHALPHWTEPPTGEVPKVVIGDAEPDAGDEQRWAAYAASSPRWRDEHDTSDHGDLMADLAAVADDEPVAERLGALDTSDRLSDEAYLNFDDVELDPRRRGRRGSRRGRGRAPAPDPLAAIVPDDSALPPPPAGTAAPPPEAAAAPAAAAAARRAAAEATPAPEVDPAAPRPRRRPTPPSEGQPTGGRDVPQAVAVGVGLAVVALIAFKIGPAAAMVLVEVVVVLAAAEFFGAVHRGGFRPATLLGLTAVAALPVATYWKGEAAFPMVLFLAFVVGVLWYLLGVGGKVRPTANLGVTMVGIVWVGVLGAFAALILDIPAQGVSILLVAVVAAVAHDVGGFFIGRAMGRTPLSTISPNKTVEGLVGGVVSALVGVFVVAVLLGVGPFTSGEALVFGLLTAIVAPLGDLAESLFKRDLGLKDMGSILPQHGGLLDRFDGLLFVLPTAYYAARILGLAG